MNLFFEIETTESFYRDEKYMPPERMTKIALILTGNDGKTVSEFTSYIQPDGFIMDINIQKKNRAELARLQGFGLPIGVVLDAVESFLSMADVVVAHNFLKAQQVILTEIYRLNGTAYPDPFAEKDSYCTMLSTVDLCKIPAHGSYKNPEINDSYRFFFDVDLVGVGMASGRAKGVRKIYFALKNEGLL